MKKATKIERRERRKKIVLNIFLLITILSIMFIIVFKSDLFKIKNIEVVGNNKLASDYIIDYTTIHNGENIFRIKGKDIEKKLEKLPYIKEAKIKRRLPSTVIVDIVEREGKASIKTISTYHIIDIEGYILEQVEEHENLPTVLGLNIENTKLGINVFDDLEIDDIIDLLQEGNRLGLLNKINNINLESLDNINIKLNNGIDIAFGTIDNVKYKLRLLDEILEDIEKKELNCKQIIMNRGEHPIILIDD